MKKCEERTIFHPQARPVGQTLREPLVRETFWEREQGKQFHQPQLHQPQEWSLEMPSVLEKKQEEE